MNMESENIIPARRPSGRLSKPSMELLVDNQRLLAQYIEPKRKPKAEVSKLIEELGSQSNYSEKSSISSVDKYKPKKRKANVTLDKEVEEVDKVKVKDRKKIEKKDTNQLEITTNGDNIIKNVENGIKNAKDESNMLNRTAYISIELNDLVMKSIKSPDKSVEIVDSKSEDDLPLSKIYPDFKPRTNEPEKRDTFSLPPKKKIKFVNLEDLNGSSEKPVMSPVKVPKLKLVFSPTKPSVMSMPKIPKKSSAAQLNGSSDSDSQTSPHKSHEILPVSDLANTVSVTGTSPTPPVIAHKAPIETPKRCIRPSCTNIAIEDFRWDKEFCSPDCAIIYSKFLFSEWLNQRRDVVIIE